MKSQQAEMSFLEHLGELRRRIFFSLAILVIAFMVAWNFADRIYQWLAVPVLQFLPENGKLAFTSLTEPFMMYIKVSLIAALFGSSPLLFHQLWLFISPALYRQEKKWVIPFVLFTSIFFTAGGLFGYYVVFPFACRFFLHIGRDFTAIITLQEYFRLAFRVLFGIAVIFELPVLIFLLAKLRLVSAAFLWRYFRYAVVAIFIIAAIITPTPDMVTQSLFAGPMILLYLLSILIAKIVNPQNRTRKSERAARRKAGGEKDRVD